MLLLWCLSEHCAMRVALLCNRQPVQEVEPVHWTGSSRHGQRDSRHVYPSAKRPLFSQQWVQQGRRTKGLHPESHITRIVGFLSDIPALSPLTPLLSRRKRTARADLRSNNTNFRRRVRREGRSPERTRDPHALSAKASGQYWRLEMRLAVHRVTAPFVCSSETGSQQRTAQHSTPACYSPLRCARRTTC